MWAIAVGIHCRRLAVDGRRSVPNVVLHWKLSLPPVESRSIFRTDCGRLPTQQPEGLDTPSCESGSPESIKKVGSFDQRVTMMLKRLRVELLFFVGGAAPMMNCRLCKDLPQDVRNRFLRNPNQAIMVQGPKRQTRQKGPLLYGTYFVATILPLIMTLHGNLKAPALDAIIRP